ncbi:amidohydrolase family protein [Flavobacterium sp. Arc3]|jgi:N-acyl-D-amino-acid deacylase|uniref:N-acyl-D-amino-acid deacylase family protein n=1 Tax=unclassified Flavobacterium TaxID=196869 RepID=UPI00352CFCDE
MKKTNLIFIATTLLLLGCKPLKSEMNVDILIQNGTVYNGIDTMPSHESIGIKGDQIVFVGDEKNVSINASKIIDATGLIVSPGFIDPHTHADRDLNDPETSHNKPFLMQGVTTVVVGNDGSSFFPVSKYKKLYEQNGIGTNAVQLVGHGTIRGQVIGNSDRIATPDEILKMQSLVQQEMDSGAFGLSTGLFYSPGSYASTEEVISLAKTAAANNGIYDTHLRDESSYSVGLIPSIEEAIEVGRQAKLPIHISHIKCLGLDAWHESDSIVSIINAARKEGIDVTANQYPYDASATSLKAAVVPRWVESGGIDSVFIRYDNPLLRQRILEETKINITRRGGPDKLLVVSSTDTTVVGKNLLEISKILDISPEETVYNIIKIYPPKVASFNMIPEDIATFMKQDWVVTGSDGGSGHPRKYGTFPRKYHKYVKEEKQIEINQFIKGSTSRTAELLKISNRGSLKLGYFADIIIFNPETFKDIADYDDAFQFAEGLEYSIINGIIAVEKGKSTNVLAGKVLKK